MPASKSTTADSAEIAAIEGTSSGILSALDTLKLLVASEGLTSAKAVGLAALQRATFVQLPLGVAFSTTEGRLIWCNAAFEMMLGMAPGGYRNCTISELTHEEDAAPHADLHCDLWAGRVKSYSVEQRYVKVGGELLWVRVSAALVRTTEGEPVCSVGFVEDISARKNMEAEVERVQKELVSASRQAGMAEVATNVLHNVGNVLNSVNVSTSLLRERIKNTRGDGLRDVGAMLVRHKGELPEFFARDSRAKKLPDFLVALASRLSAERKSMLKELDELRVHIDHISETVTMQQTYARRCGVMEKIRAVELVEDAIRLNAAALARDRVQLTREFLAADSIMTDKHKVLQILINLLRNAKQACDDSEREDKLVKVRIERNKPNLHISVSDNGVGISPEVMPRLFTHGFTTRKTGHGFGLHAAALAAAELDGALTAHSDGPGRGATFTLTLPLKAKEGARESSG